MNLFEGDKEEYLNKFLFYQNSDIVFDYVDDDGNIFKVDKLGKCTSMPSENERSHSSVSNYSIAEYSNHAPR